MLELVLKINRMSFDFDHFEAIGGYFKRIINVLKQLNYAAYQSEAFNNLLAEYETVINEKRVL